MLSSWRNWVRLKAKFALPREAVTVSVPAESAVTVSDAGTITSRMAFVTAGLARSPEIVFAIVSVSVSPQGVEMGEMEMRTGSEFIGVEIVAEEDLSPQKIRT